MVWFKGKVPKFSMCAWMAFNNGLKTKALIVSRGIQCSTICCLCSSGQETRKHLFIECASRQKFVKNSMEEIIKESGYRSFSKTSLKAAGAPQSERQSSPSSTSLLSSGTSRNRGTPAFLVERLQYGKQCLRAYKSRFNQDSSP